MQSTTSDRYPVATVVSVLLYLFGALLGLVGVVFAFRMAGSNDPANDSTQVLGVAIGGVLLGLFYLTIGEILRMIRDIANNSFRAGLPPVVAVEAPAPPPEPEDLSDFRPEVRNPDAPQTTIDEALGIGTRVSTLQPSDLRKVVVCNMCSARIGIPASSEIKGGDRIKCPKCGATNAVQ